MKNQNRLWTGLIAALGLTVLILDARTALSGAKQGIDLCMQTVIPALFPFFFLSTAVNRSFLGKRIRILKPICNICGVPNGAESLLLLGFLGGYPVGAQCIAEAYTNKLISKEQAGRMLGFCNNAGPAFLFGMVGSMFTSVCTVWVLWGIHVISALIVGYILPGRQKTSCSLEPSAGITMTQALEKSIKIMASVCGWVIIFRVLLAFCYHWFFWLFPHEIQVGLIGILELSNGCCELRSVAQTGTRFLLCAAMLGFGGICVAMQTASVTKALGTGMYFPGKLMHGTISFLLAWLLQPLLFNQDEMISLPYLAVILPIAVFIIVLLLLYRRKKVVAFRHDMVYNGFINT